MEKKQILRTNQVPTKVPNTDARKLNQGRRMVLDPNTYNTKHIYFGIRIQSRIYVFNIQQSLLLSQKTILIRKCYFIQSDALGKQQTRNLRRRDFPNNFVQSQRNDRTNFTSNYQHKQQQQQQQQPLPLPLFAAKPRGNDKQQRNTNRPNGDATTSHGTRLTRTYDADSVGANFEAEMNSVYLPGSKKQNLNHLLNFNFPSRERNGSISYQRTGNNAKGARFVKPVKYNKELYLLAK